MSTRIRVGPTTTDTEPVQMPNGGLVGSKHDRRAELEEPKATPTVAMVHDYLTQMGGAERVVLSLVRAFPGAPLHTSLYNAQTTFPDFAAVDVRRLGLDRIAPFRRRHRLALPVLAPAFASSRVDADVVLCSSSGWSHGIRTEGRKIIYCHSPAKWLYRRNEYLGSAPSKLASAGLRLLDPYLRWFDRRAAASADTYVANSTFVARQIREVYGYEAEVVCPPASLRPEGAHQPIPEIDPGFFLTIARLLPYKNVPKIISAFRKMPRRRLVVVGEGRAQEAIAASAPRNVQMISTVDDARLRWLYSNCTGVVSASREDFGLTSIEAASFGKPVAALRWGGFLDTVQAGVTGVFFDAAEPSEIAHAVEDLAQARFNSNEILDHANTFSEEQFIDRMRAIVLDA